MFKSAIISYHKNASLLYPKDWIDKYRLSIESQTYKSFDIFENNYGGGQERIFNQSEFEARPFPTFVHSLNYLLDKVFSLGYDVAVNQNCDDYYRHDFLERLLIDSKKGFDIVSCNFCLVKDGRIFKYHRFHSLNILNELENGHNPVAHPAVIYSRKFWEQNRYNPDEIPEEDFKLWKRALKSGSKFFINEQNLLFHRIHSNAVCQSENR